MIVRETAGDFPQRDTFVKVMYFLVCFPCFFFKQTFLYHEDKQRQTKIAYLGMLQNKSLSSKCKLSAMKNYSGTNITYFFFISNFSSLVLSPKMNKFFLLWSYSLSFLDPDEITYPFLSLKFFLYLLRIPLSLSHHCHQHHHPLHKSFITFLSALGNMFLYICIKIYLVFCLSQIWEFYKTYYSFKELSDFHLSKWVWSFT